MVKFGHHIAEGREIINHDTFKDSIPVQGKAANRGDLFGGRKNDGEKKQEPVGKSRYF